MRTSPDGTVVVRYESHDFAQGLWVHEPLVYRARDERLLVDLRGTSLDAEFGTTFPGPGLVRLALRKAPVGSVQVYDLTIDVEAETFVSGEGDQRPLAELPDVVRELRATTPAIRARDLAAARCPQCGGHLRRAGVSAFDTTKAFECQECGRVWS